MKKFFGILAVTLITTFVFGTNVSASSAYRFYEDVNVPKKSYKIFGPFEAGYNYVYGAHKITKLITDGADVHTSLMTVHDNQFFATTDQTTITKKDYTVLWKPSKPGSSSELSYNTSSACKASSYNTTDNYCIVSGNSYGTLLQNKNIIFSFTVNGQFIYVD